MRWVALAILLACSGCLWDELGSVTAARTALQECIAEHSESHPDCLLARGQLDDAQRTYVEDSQDLYPDPCSLIGNDDDC